MKLSKYNIGRCIVFNGDQGVVRRIEGDQVVCQMEDSCIATINAEELYYQNDNLEVEEE